MAEQQPITKVKALGESFGLGATFDNIFLSEEDDFTLKDFHDYIKQYFNQDMFMMYSENEPAADNVKVWYDTKEQEI